MACAAPSLLRVSRYGTFVSDPLWIALSHKDAAQIMSKATRSISHREAVSISIRGGFPHGYAYQSTIAAIAHVLGLSVERADLAVAPFFRIGTGPCCPLYSFGNFPGASGLEFLHRYFYLFNLSSCS